MRAGPYNAPLALQAAGHYANDQLLVASSYSDVVISALRAMRLRLTADPERSPLLSLTRLTLSSDLEDRTLLSDSTLDVGLVLDRLRKKFAEEYNGWYPTMGKNRTVFDNVIGGGSTSYGGDGTPQAIGWPTRNRVHKEWSARPAAPGSGVRVAMVDTKMTAAKPLAGAWYARTQDTLRTASSFRDGHATFVAGMILGQAPGAIVDVRAILENGQADSWSTALAIAEQGRSGADILNLSFSCLTADGQPPLALATAISLLPEEMVVVAAAGNHGRFQRQPVEIDKQEVKDVSKCVAFPAGLDNVIAVGSVRADDEARAPYSPKGVWVDIAAYGDRVTSTFPTFDNFRGFATWSGTSFAAARVSGAIAAQTVPGKIHSRAAWEEIFTTLQRKRAAAKLPLDEPPVLRPESSWGS